MPASKPPSPPASRASKWAPRSAASHSTKRAATRSSSRSKSRSTAACNSPSYAWQKPPRAADSAQSSRRAVRLLLVRHVRRLVRRNHLLRNFIRHVVVVRELHGVAPATLRQRRQLIRVTQHLRKRHLRLDRHAPRARIAAADLPAPAAEMSQQVAGILIRRVHLHRHYWFEQARPRLFHRFLERERPRDLERHVARIDVVIFAVVQAYAEIHHRKSREVSALR